MLGKIFHELAGQKEGRIVEGHLLSDHVHMGLEIPPKHAVASGIGFLKGKSALAIAQRVQEKDRNFMGEHFWARGYAVSMVGFKLESVKKYIREQETGSVAKLIITDCYPHHIVVLSILYSIIWYGSESLRQSRAEGALSGATVSV